MTLSVLLPPRFLARDCWLSAEQSATGWLIVARDINGVPWPLDINGLGSHALSRHGSASAALTMLQALGFAEGDRIFATPSERF